MSKKTASSLKKEIFLPSAIGDWTTYSSEKNKQSISITKTIGASNKTVPEKNIDELLFFHQEFFEVFFERIAQEINSHIDVESVSVNVLNHDLFKEELTQDIYQCKFNIPELEQIDLIFSKKTTRFIAHRLCGGATAPDASDPPSEVEIALVSVVNNLFIECLSNHWRTIFPVVTNTHSVTFGHYHFQPQQADSEAIIEFRANIRLFNQSDMHCKVIYSLETIEKLLFFRELLNSNIIENTMLNKITLTKSSIPVKSIIGTTTLALHDIQSLELGDVILLDNQKVSDPIQFIVDDCITFTANPVQIDHDVVGVQITGYPAYDSFLKNGQKPSTGPFTAAAPEPVIDEPTPQKQPQHMDTPLVDHHESTSMPPPETEATMPEVPSPIEGEDDGDFSWDELDAE